jgi:glutamate formiminotransferase / 5-formyltetrahydrofolate cyclo-ligase
MKLLECVPNFSEGQDKKKIDAIASALQKVSGVRLLDICTDPDHNRTVFTFLFRDIGVDEKFVRYIFPNPL